ncbi:F-box protein PP2-A15 [Apostasia shenzhenica]|uniref:F-box protein PP2-A15 n=1 Tax=Apostasia shenzhenica TaxID=1088818 RepID=A0A2I0AW04_9ASPA|nr:F-box protein PP2-A15 [Apostasia shenzhenica]
MGASLSSLTEVGNGGVGGPGLGDIPESCVACVFMYLTPPEICNLARLNRAFRGAASSDFVWESKLPPSYPLLLELLPPESYQCISKKKDIFAVLSRPVLFDDGTKVVWLNRVTSGVCVSVSAKAMSITGIEDRRYWGWITTEESRFHVVAYLQQIWWFEVDGSIKFPFSPGTYSLFFRLHLGRSFRRLGRRVCNYGHTHGWEIKPVRFEISTSDGQEMSCGYCLDDYENGDANGNSKRGVWIDYHVGDFIVRSLEVVEVRFSMKQIDCTHSKGGLCVDSVSIMPTKLGEKKQMKS